MAVKKKAAKAKVFSVGLTAADISNLIAIINSASIKGDSVGTVHELKRKLVNVLPPPKPAGGDKHEGANPKNK